MKPVWKAALFGIALTAILALATQDAISGISWVQGYDNGMLRAKRENKPAMLDFTAAWCGWCKKLDKVTFTDPKVQEFAKSFICIKVNANKERKQMKSWSIRGIPHILFLDPDGKLLNRISGYKDAGPFAQEMQKALNKFTPKKTSGGAKASSSGSSSAPLFIECAKCKNIFNTTATKGYCTRCEAKYEAN